MILCLGASSALVTACESAAVSPRSEPLVLRLSTGLVPAGGTSSLLAEALADSFERTSRKLSVKTRPTAGSVANVEAIQLDEVDVGQAAADVAYQAFIGRLDPKRGRFDRLRAIAVLELTPVQLLARRDAPIRNVADLRGRRVAVGPQGAGTTLTARLILQAFGIPPSAVQIKSLPFSDAGAMLIKGSLDAMFQNAVRTETADRALRAGARLIPITGSPINRLRHEYPFFRLTVISRGRADGTATIPTIGVDNLLLCRRDLSEAVVHEITSRLFDILPSLSLSRGVEFVDLDQAPATPIPLHDGASRYYREQELLR